MTTPSVPWSADEPSRRSVLAAAGILPLAPAARGRKRRRAATYTLSYVDFADVTPSYLTPTQSWNSLGLDDSGRLYINWTSTRDDGREDTALFRYTHSTGEKEYLGSFIDVAEEAGNLSSGEQIPKGHTRIVQVGRKLYLGSQGFHDFKAGIGTLPQYRGAHLFTYDLDTGAFEDVSASMPGGVVIEHQGIVALSWSPEHDLLAGLSHPHGDIVLIDPAQNEVRRVVPGIPWALNKVVSREIVVTKTGKIYTYRGPEDPARRAETNPVWVYDLATDTMRGTGTRLRGGFWNGQAISADRNRIYLSTVSGELYRLNVAAGTFSHLAHLVAPADYTAAAKYRVAYLYGIGLTADEKEIVGWPIVAPTGTGGTSATRLTTYSIPNATVAKQFDATRIAFTGSNHRDGDGNFYQAAFDWDHNCRLAILSPV